MGPIRYNHENYRNFVPVADRKSLIQQATKIYNTGHRDAREIAKMLNLDLDEAKDLLNMVSLDIENQIDML